MGDVHPGKGQRMTLWTGGSKVSSQTSWLSEPANIECQGHFPTPLPEAAGWVFALGGEVGWGGTGNVFFGEKSPGEPTALTYLFRSHHSHHHDISGHRHVSGHWPREDSASFREGNQAAFTKGGTSLGSYRDIASQKTLQNSRGGGWWYDLEFCKQWNSLSGEKLEQGRCRAHKNSKIPTRTPFSETSRERGPS